MSPRTERTVKSALTATALALALAAPIPLGSWEGSPAARPAHPAIDPGLDAGGPHEH